MFENNDNEYIFNELVSSKIDTKNFNKYLLAVFVNKKVMTKDPSGLRTPKESKEKYEKVKQFMKLHPEIYFIKTKTGLVDFFEEYFNFKYVKIRKEFPYIS